MQIQAKRVDEKFYKIPQWYYLIFGGILPAIIFTSIPNFSNTFFVIQATGPTWYFAFFIVTAVTALLFVCCSTIIVMFGIMIALVIKDNREKIVGIKKAIVDILTSKDANINNADSKIILSGFRKIVNEELEAILKKYGIIPTIPIKTGLSISNESYQKLKNEFDEFKEQKNNEIANLKSRIEVLESDKSENEQEISAKSQSQNNDDNTKSIDKSKKFEPKD